MSERSDQTEPASHGDENRAGVGSLEGEETAATSSHDPLEVEAVPIPETHGVPQQADDASITLGTKIRGKAGQGTILVAVLGVTLTVLAWLIPRRRWGQVAVQGWQRAGTVTTWATDTMRRVSGRGAQPTKRQLVRYRLQQALEANRVTLAAGTLAIALSIAGQLIDRRRAQQRR